MDHNDHDPTIPQERGMWGGTEDLSVTALHLGWWKRSLQLGISFRSTRPHKRLVALSMGVCDLQSIENITKKDHTQREKKRNESFGFIWIPNKTPKKLRVPNFRIEYKNIRDWKADFTTNHFSKIRYMITFICIFSLLLIRYY